MRRREFISFLGAVAAWPAAARAQQTEQTRRVGVLMNTVADDPDGQAGVAAFSQALQKLDSHVRIDTRWGENDEDLDRKYAAELFALAPDVFLAGGSLSAAALKRVTRTVPIVFVSVADPVGGGFVDSGLGGWHAIYASNIAGAWAIVRVYLRMRKNWLR